MTYDLLIKNGRIIDGSGRPAFYGDVGVAQGKIVEMGASTAPRGESSRPMDAPSRQGSSTTTVTMMRRSSGIRCAPSPVTTAPPPSSSGTARWRSLP